AVDVVSSKVYDEMDDVKDALRGTISSITPEFLMTWDINSTMDRIVNKSAPTLHRLLESASQTDRARRENTKKTSTTVCNVIVAQLANQRSHHSLYLAAPFTITLWTNGASRQTIETLAKCGLCISFSSLTTLLKTLASRSLDRAIQVAQGPHILCYDNINISTSIFVEQRSSAPAKVQSGTFPIIYEVRNGNHEHMRLAPMLGRAQQAFDLTFNADIRPTVNQIKSSRDQFKVHITDILLECCAAFKNYTHRSEPALQHQERRKLPGGYKTKQYPLRTTTIDESSITGNIAVIVDAYTNQLKLTKDINPFTRLQCLQLGFGLFHLCMNLIWALLHVHRGSINQPGSLSYFFAVLDRVRLGCEHPDYHTLLATLMQILRGVILNAWHVECGYPSLAAFAASSPTPAELLNVATRILKNHGTAPYDPPSKK
ncbi:hypothetical protein PAXINDRAFT_47855, partial [Paxillus involutus ATCC 200175]